jgi:xanthine dehydrogenase accessory factor
VDVAWAVETHGFSSRDAAEALAITPGGGRVGSVLSGLLNDQLADLAGEGVSGRLVDVRASDNDALAAGLSCGGDARCLLVPAADLPAELWDRLRDREPVCLVTCLDGDQVADTTLFTAETIAEAGEDVSRRFNRGVSDNAVAADLVVTVLWPVPTVVIIGAGAIADALAAAAALLGWHTREITDVDEATATIAGLAVVDKVVVLSHDEELGGRALAAALSARPGYIGALGSRRTQQARADWLADHGITELNRIYGPAGLDIGANTPAEIAVSVLAEAMAVKAGSKPHSLRERTGPIH